MAIIADKQYSLIDYAKQFDPSGQELAIAEVLSKSNDIVGDALVVESSLDSGHEYAVRTGIPEGTWRRAYQGIEPAKATTKVVVESYGTLSAYSVVDKLVAEKGGNVEGVRTGQSRAIIAGMSNTMAANLIYGNAGKNPERFTGLAARYCELSGAESSRNVINAGGQKEGKNSSIYLVVWDTDKIFTFFPKGSKAGIQRLDHGLVNHIDANGNEYPAYKEYFEWKLGLAVQDWRFAGRICNIDVENVPADLIDQMCELEECIQSLSMGKPVWYMNRTVKAALRKLTSNRTNVQYTPDQVTARPLMTFNEIPVHICDAITDTETLVK
ncbi:major capsid protein [Candidatus Avelusimicrobium sp.]|uniref:major capsid protein n=1 Tax=Candidatus Avelusimicrobium sp. TaxID=3048833 RepID=UPI003F80143E